MSDFIFVIPTTWTQISQEMIDQIGAIQIDNWIKMADFTSLGNALGEVGGPGQINEAIFFNAEILAVKTPE